MAIDVWAGFDQYDKSNGRIQFWFGKDEPEFDGVYFVEDGLEICRKVAQKAGITGLRVGKAKRFRIEATPVDK